MKRYIVLLVGLLAVGTAFAQFDPQMGQYMYLPAAYNPAAAGEGDLMKVAGMHRMQYVDEQQGLTVRPPRLGGNERVGVFASRSPFRPNRLGLSCVRIEKVEMTEKDGPVILVRGADLMDGTPIYDIKPYVTYADSHPEARSGFVDKTEWKPLQVEIPQTLSRLFSEGELKGLRQVLSQDPRPRYHDDAERIYGMPFAGWDVRFRVADDVVTVVEVHRN